MTKNRTDHEVVNDLIALIKSFGMSQNEAGGRIAGVSQSDLSRWGKPFQRVNAAKRRAVEAFLALAEAEQRKILGLQTKSLRPADAAPPTWGQRFVDRLGMRWEIGRPEVARVLGVSTGALAALERDLSSDDALFDEAVLLLSIGPETYMLRKAVLTDPALASALRFDDGRRKSVAAVLIAFAGLGKPPIGAKRSLAWVQAKTIGGLMVQGMWTDTDRAVWGAYMDGLGEDPPTEADWAEYLEWQGSRPATEEILHRFAGGNSPPTTSPEGVAADLEEIEEVERSIDEQNDSEEDPPPEEKQG